MRNNFQEDSDEIIKGLEGILSDIDSGRLEMDMTAEDIHMFIEAELTKRLGDVGKDFILPVQETIRLRWIPVYI